MTLHKSLLCQGCHAPQLLGHPGSKSSLTLRSAKSSGASVLRSEQHSTLKHRSPFGTFGVHYRAAALVGAAVLTLLALTDSTSAQSLPQNSTRNEIGSEAEVSAVLPRGINTVVAIDIGTAETGSAYFFKETPFLYQSGLKDMLTVTKIPTSVLVDMTVEPEGISFGDQAVADYENMRNDPKGGKFALFERFKMSMFNEKGILAARPKVRTRTCRLAQCL